MPLPDKDVAVPEACALMLTVKPTAGLLTVPLIVTVVRVPSAAYVAGASKTRAAA